MNWTFLLSIVQINPVHCSRERNFEKINNNINKILNKIDDIIPFYLDRANVTQNIVSDLSRNISKRFSI